MPSDSDNSSRTSGGISKSLLTPIRRLGLTRRRRTPGVSPLSLTPLSSLKTPVVTSTGSSICNIGETSIIEDGKSDICTPARKLGLNRRQQTKKKISLTSGSHTDEDHKCIENAESFELNKIACDILIKNSLETVKENTVVEFKNYIKENSSVLKTVFPESSITEETKKLKPTTPEKVQCLSRNNSKENTLKTSVAATSAKKFKETTPKGLRKKKSGDLDLKRKCIVVIDKHILKSKEPLSATEKNTTNIEAGNDFPSSSDVDDVPLSEISKRNNIATCEEVILPQKRLLDDVSAEDTDFCEKRKRFSQTENKPKAKVVKLEKTKSTGSSSSKESVSKSKILRVDLSLKPKVIKLSDSDDDGFECKKTILIRKSYPKALHKAKSTGSITQKDIDDIKSRINMKKNALLIKSRGHNIEELTQLIKKWRIGCQEALMELLEIMKRKVPEKQNMKTSQLLKMLNIPVELVGYNSEDDCFLTPT